MLKGLVELASMLGVLKVVGLRIAALKVVDTGVGVATIILNVTVDRATSLTPLVSQMEEKAPNPDRVLDKAKEPVS